MYSEQDGFEEHMYVSRKLACPRLSKTPLTLGILWIDALIRYTDLMVAN